MNSDTGIREAVLTEIRDLAEKYGLERVVLFGSRARGDHSERSDIDLAVSGGNALNFYYDLEENAWTLLMFDVVALDKGIHEELQAEISRDGVILYEEI